MDNFNIHYYITPQNNNNNYLDSIILIPVCLLNSKEKKFKLISFQITINKKKIYTLNEYQNATITAANLIEEIYDIKIVDKYFIFVLAKDYNNISTQNTLLKLEIPFIFYSSINKAFYLNENKRPASINDFIDDKFRVLNIKDINIIETIDNKNLKFKKMTLLLNNKRKRDKEKITKNLFSFIRKKMFNNENELNFSSKEKNDIIKNITKNKYYNNKAITIEYSYKVNFTRIYELRNYDNLLGIVFYKKKMFLINKNLDSFIQIYNDKKKSKNEELNSFYALIFQNKIISKKDENLKNIIPSSTQANLSYLLNYYNNRPSDIFIYSIYEID